MAPITGVLQTRLSAIALCLLAASTSTTINSVNAQVLVPFSQNTDHHQLSARAENAVGTKLTSQLYNYVVKAAIGTPPQEVKLVINPSVGDTWVPDGTSYACRATSRYRYCDEDDEPYDPNEWADKSPTCIEGRTNTSGSCIWGSFLKSQSSTYLPANSRLSTFSVTTVEDLDVRGTNFTDKLTVGEIELDDYPMGLITSDDRNIGVLGLGRNSSYSYGDYVNFIDRLVRSGKIKSQAYSIWLDDPEGTSGNLLFGAVDKAKYEGDLIRVSARESNVFSRTFGISLTGINGTKGSGETMPAIRTNEFPVPVTVSPGELYSYLPDDIVDSVAAMVGASWNSRAQMMMIPCDAAKTNPVSFSFQILGSGGPVLKVETADLILPLEFRYSSSRVTSLPDGTCIFGIQQWDSSSSSSSSSSYSSYSTTYYNLGSALLKRTYMVFDLSNRQVALAPVKFSAGSSSDVVPFKTWGAYIPSAKSFDGSVLCDEGMENMSGRCYTSDGRRSGSGSGSSSGGYNDGFVDSESHWNRVALGVGIAFGILILISLVAAVVICTRRSKAKKDALKKQADLEGAPSVENVGGALPASGVAAASATRDVSGSPSPGASLSVIQEGKEEASQNAPQLPALSVTPLPAEEPKNVTSAVPVEPQVQTQPSTQVEEPKVEDVKGKGKEVDRSQ